jgi:hypothetical protein
MKCRSFVIGAVVAFAAALIPVNAAAQKDTNPAAALNAYRPPTPVIEVNEAAKKPFAVWTTLEFGKEGPEEPPKDELPPGPIRLAQYKESEDLFVVPKDMILVIDYVNAVACFQPDEQMSINIKTGYAAGRTPANLKILLNEQGVFNEPDEGVYMHSGASQQMKIYIRGGDAFRFTAWRSGSAGHAETEVWISGYLMPAR